MGAKISDVLKAFDMRGGVERVLAEAMDRADACELRADKAERLKRDLAEDRNRWQKRALAAEVALFRQPPLFPSGSLKHVRAGSRRRSEPAVPPLFISADQLTLPAMPDQGAARV